MAVNLLDKGGSILSPGVGHHHHPDWGDISDTSSDLTSQNSNDSSSGGAQPAMRPTPSPTGSTGSRSMSPAVGQQNIPMPPRPSSGQSDTGSTSSQSRMSHSPMATQSGYQQQPLAPPPHMHNYKMGPGGPSGPLHPSNMVPNPIAGPPYSAQIPPHQQYPQQSNYSGRSLQGMPAYPNYGMQQPGCSQQYASRPMLNHVQHSQFPAYQHKVMFGNAPGAMPPSPGQPPPNMYGSNSSSPGMGPPPHHHPMGPPLPGTHHHYPAGMGPPMSNMIPPSLSNSHHEMPMPPPSSSVANQHPMASMHSMHNECSMENLQHDHSSPSLTTTASGNMTNVSQINSGGITSVVTTGPDGTPVDEASQQSTLSNASAASGDDPSSTPKRKEQGMSMLGTMGNYMGPGGGGAGAHGHTTGQMPPCSPGINSIHDDYPGADNSPPWSRTPSSPVFNSHINQDIYRPKKHDSLSKLYEMDDSPERRIWLDKLLQFMEERASPISACPTISKNPLDLFRLYLYVKDRGGFMEVCKVTKNKIWKDIAGLLGIGASSSAAYTLRKHYTKNLLPYECHFDRGGIDPQPIINQIESTSKKKSSKPAPVPSPGSSNSQDSFPSGPTAAMDSYTYGYPPDYAAQRGPPPPMHGNQNMAAQGAPYSSQPTASTAAGYSQYPSEQYGQQYMGGPTNAYLSPSSRPPVYPIYPPPDPDRSYSQSNSSPMPPGGSQPQQSMQPSPGVPPGGQDPYSRSPYGQSIYHPRPTFSSPAQQMPPSSTSNQTPSSQVAPSSPTTVSQSSQSYTPSSPQHASQQQQQQQSQPTQQQTPQPSHTQQSPQPQIPSPQPPTTNQSSVQSSQQPPVSQSAQSIPPPVPSVQQPPLHEYYRPDQVYPTPNQNQIPPASGTSSMPYPPNKGMPPPPGAQPRRHPDFSKEQQQSPYPSYNNQQRPVYGPGWPNSANSSNQFRGVYPPGQPVLNSSPSQQWNQGPVPRPPITNSQQTPPNAQWDQHRYPPSSQSFPPNQPPAPPLSNQWNMGPTATQTPPRSPRSTFRSDGTKTFPPMSQPQSVKGPTTAPPPSPSIQHPAVSQVKRELVFPTDSVEAVTPLIYKRKKLTRSEVTPVDPWKLLMSLRSGLLAETSYVLDVLNALLYDDVAVQYFGLTHMPGLLDILLEHFKHSLADVFERNKPDNETKWYEHSVETCTEPDLGQIRQVPDPSDKLPIRASLPDYSLKSRRGIPVGVVDGSEDLFVNEEKRSWDGRNVDFDELIEPDTGYIVPCFKSEFGRVPFVRLLEPGKNKNGNTIKEEPVDSPKEAKPEIKSELASEASSIAGVEDNEDEEEMKFVPEKSVKTEVPENYGDDNAVNADDVDMQCTTDASSTDAKPSDQRSSVDADEEVADVKPENVKMETDADEENNSWSANCCANETNDNSRNDKRGEDASAENNDHSDAGDECDDKKKLTDSLADDLVEKKLKRMKCSIKDTVGVLKRRKLDQFEDECYCRDEASLCLIGDTQDIMARRCVTLSSILRNLTFVPGNEFEFAKNANFLILMGKLLLLHHEHPLKTQKQKNYDREEDSDFSDCCSSLYGESEWWWDFMHHVRESVLVSITNISSCMDLSIFSEEVSRPVLDGLLHWCVCTAAQGQDSFAGYSLSPQRLALEALCKLCVNNANVDLVIATPPYTRLEKLTSVLTRLLCKSEDQVLREFAVNLLHYLAAADSSMSRIIALQSPCISLLVAFIEQADQSALGVANQHGINTLRDNPELMGTSLDMLRRAARTLLHLSKHPDNRSLFLQQEQRLLALVMSQILDQQVAAIISQVLYQCSRSPSPTYNY